LVSAAWDAINACVEKEKQQSTKIDEEPKPKQDDKTTSESTDDKTVAKKRKIEDPGETTENGSIAKRKRTDSSENVDANSKEVEDINGDSAANGKQENEDGQGKKFNWRKAIKSLLNAQPEKYMKLKSLRKEVTAQYKQNGKKKGDLSEDDLKNLFDKAIERLTVREFLQVDGKVVRVAQKS